MGKPGATERISVLCPVCGNPTPRAIPRYAGVHGYFDHSGGRACRILVVPDPVGEDHWTYPVPDDVSIEEAMDRLPQDSEPVRWRVKAATAWRQWLLVLEDRPEALAS